MKILSLILISLSFSAFSSTDCNTLKKAIQAESNLPIFYSYEDMVTLGEYVNGSWSRVDISFKSSDLLENSFIELALERIKRIDFYPEVVSCAGVIDREMAIKIISEETAEGKCQDGLRKDLLEAEAFSIEFKVKQANEYKQNCL